MKLLKLFSILSVVLLSMGLLLTSCDNRVVDPQDYTISSMTSSTNVIYSDDDESTFAIIRVMVKDKDNFAVFGENVQFKTDLGYLTPSEALTDSSGIATVKFHDGGAFGEATIEAIIGAESRSINVYIDGVPPQDVASIGFDVSAQIEISVQGTGGTESYPLVASLYDNSGQLINQPKTVWFELLSAPEGTNINNVGLIDSTTSVAGKASVNINSGGHSGIVTCKVYTFKTDGTTVSSTKSNIVVASGFTHTVEFAIGGHSSGMDMGSGRWRVQISALLNDVEGNPVASGTAVFFSLPDDPEWASVVAAAYVNNQNVQGDSLAGVAYTLLNYNGTHTNDTISVRIETGVGDIFEGQLKLPIQFPSIDIAAVPLHVDWDQYNNPSDWRDHTVELSPYVEITILDGQNNPISNQPVIFTSTLGTPVRADQLNMSPTNPSFVPSYQAITDSSGHLIKYFRFYKYECPPPVPAPPGTTTGTVTAQILGTSTSNQVTIILRRYID
ncbi:MAG: Ig-like domain-containing protein [Candidatus Cloacimonetes bacterium]|nr:Ig-like domain-containing protein [Candidatus Cloacimonadota bacterium]